MSPNNKSIWHLGRYKKPVFCSEVINRCRDCHLVQLYNIWFVDKRKMSQIFGVPPQAPPGSNGFNIYPPQQGGGSGFFGGNQQHTPLGNLAAFKGGFYLTTFCCLFFDVLSFIIVCQVIWFIRSFRSAFLSSVSSWLSKFCWHFWVYWPPNYFTEPYRVLSTICWIENADQPKRIAPCQSIKKDWTV